MNPALQEKMRQGRIAKAAQKVQQARQRQENPLVLDARQAEWVKRAGTVSESAKSIVYKAFQGTATPRQAIAAKCLECCCWQRVEVRECGIKSCPHWLYRPYTKDVVP